MKQKLKNFAMILGVLSILTLVIGAVCTFMSWFAGVVINLNLPEPISFMIYILPLLSVIATALTFTLSEDNNAEEDHQTES